MKKVSGLPTRSEVLSRFFDVWTVPEPSSETIPTPEAYGRILARDIFSLVDKPVVRASSMDGIGVKSASFTPPNESSIAALNKIAALWRLGADYCRADTGDDFSDDFDTVIQIEDVTFLPDGGVRFAEDMELPVVSGRNVQKKGSQLPKGALIGAKYTKINACDIAALAIGGIAEVEVLKKPKVAFIPTGNELVPLGELPQRGQCVDSNSYMAQYMLEEMGAEPMIYPIIRDDFDAVNAALSKALKECDAVIINAGTSKGGEDFSHRVIAERGVLTNHGVASAPGKPMAMALVDGKPVINVAGPTVACFNGLDWAVRPVIAKALRQPPAVRKTVKATLAAPIDGGQGERFEAIVRIELEKTDRGYLAHPVSHRNRHTTDALKADGLYVTKIPPEPTSNGDMIEVELLR
jgi:molybdopterin molybdotransferase/putative molybdopterin biosynthesis protein